MAYNSKYSTYKKYTASTEVSYASHTANTSYQREQSSEYTSNKGILSSTKEIVSGTETRSLPVYIAIQDFTPEDGDKDSMPLEQGQIVEVLDSKNPSSWLVRTKARPPRTGWIPGSYFETPTEYYKQRRRTREIEDSQLSMTPQQEAIRKRDCVFEELVKKEEEFVQELRHVIETYVKVFDDPATPDAVRHYRDQLTLNLREIYNFHANVLLKGLHYYSDDPGKVGQTFVRLERDFDYHVKYCRDEPDAEKLLAEEKVKEYFEGIKDKIEAGDKTLVDYLRLPIQRIQQYQNNLKELIKYTTRAELNTKSLSKSLELMLSLPQRATDLNFVRNIHGYPGDTVKLGRLLRHEHFYVWKGDSAEGASKLLYLFLFKSRIVMTEKIEPEDSEDLPEFKHFATVRLDKYDIDDVVDENVFVMRAQEGEDLETYCVKPMDTAEPAVAKQAWVKEIQETKQGLGPDEGPPRKKPKSPPAISPSGSAVSLYSGSSGDLTGTTLEMQGTRVTRTQYGFRTLQESSAKMCLKVTGFPLPLITWFKDGVQLEEDERHTFYADDEGFFAMTIDPVKVEDTGRYTCVATNEYGQASTSAFFRVIKVEHEPASPKFECELKDQEIPEGESVRFQCELDGWPEPEIVWLVDGQVVHPTPDFRIEYDGQKALLEIKDAQPEDAGTYSVRITNELGTKESSARLTVQEDPEKSKVPPEFQQTLEDIECDEGDTIRFKAVITGDPLPDVNWLINGQGLTASSNIDVLAEDGIYMITIKKITTHFDGEMMCRAVNRIGEASSTARVTVRAKMAPPTFDHQLSDQSVNVGDAVKMTVAVSGNPDPVLKWFIDGKELVSGKDGVSLVSKGDGVHRLEIASANESHAGKISCKATNEEGEAETHANLKVVAAVTEVEEEVVYEEEMEAEEMSTGEEEPTKKAPSFLKSLDAVSVEEGQEAVLKAKISGDPTPQIIWVLNGKELAEGKDIKIESDGETYILTLLNLSTSQSGTVECRAKNSAGDATSEASLDVTTKPVKKVPPQMTQALKGAAAIEGDKVSFQIKVDGTPAPTVSWDLNGKPIVAGKEPDGMKLIDEGDGVYKLEIAAVTKEMNGMVSASVENDAGTVNSEAELKVRDKTEAPQFKEALEPQIVNEGDTVEMKIVASGLPAPDVKWSIGGKEIKDGVDKIKIESRKDGEFVLVIPDISASKCGEVSCRIENSAGIAESKATLAVKKAPIVAQVEKTEESVSEQVSEETTVIETKESITKTSMVSASTVPAPEIKSELKDYLLKEGEDLKLEVQTEGQVDEVAWALNDNPLQKSGSVTIHEKPEEGNYQLHIKEIQKDMAGIYSATVSNEGGEVTTEAQVGVKARRHSIKPEIQSTLSAVKLNEGDMLKTKVLISGDDVQVKWYINERIVVQTEDVVMTKDNGVFTLSIDGASTDMTGNLKCVAYNRCGETETVAPINVSAAPIPVEFEQFLADATCREGDTLKLKAVLLGEPSPDVNWYINGKKLVDTDKVTIEAEKSTYTVVIKDITCDYSGEVLCKAVNEYGEASSSAMLTVIPRGDPPDFTEWLSNVQVKEGGTVNHRVVFTGDPSPKLTWYINGKEMPQDKNVTIKQEGNTCLLTIHKFTGEYVGEVICKAENDAGEVSCTAHMTILGIEIMSEHSELDAVAEDMDLDDGATDTALSIPDDEVPEDEYTRTSTPVMAPKFITKMKDTKVKKGSQAIFECVVPDSKGVVVKWLKDGKEVQLITRIRVMCKPGEGQTQRLQIAIDKVEVSDMGQYECVISNSAGQEICTAKLIVESAPDSEETQPMFVSQLVSVTVTEEQQIKLECKVSGQPKPEIKWLHDEKEISANTSIKLESKSDGTQVLLIEKCCVNDKGTYKCVASSTVGSCETTSEVVVQSKPVFRQQLQESIVEEGTKVELTCAVDGQPTPTVQWCKDGKTVQADAQHEILATDSGVQTLLLSSAAVQDAGLYQCQAQNEAGKADTQAKLEIKKAVQVETPTEEAVAFSKELGACTVVEGEDALFECVISGMATVKWLKDGKPLKADGRHVIIESDTDGTQSLEIVKCKADDVAVYTCKADVKTGEISTKAPLKVNMAEEKVEEPMQIAPEFSTPLKPCTVTEGESMALECALADANEVKVEWLKDSSKVTADGEHVTVESLEDGTQTLTITHARTEDAGEYTCKAVNKAGEAKTQAPLDVKHAKEETVQIEEAPAFSSELEPCTVDEHDTAKFECAVTGKAVVQWLKDGSPVQPDGEHITIESNPDGTQMLMITDALQKDIGSYTCQASNDYGSAASQALLNVHLAQEVDEQVPAEVAPEFTVPLQPVSIEEGQEAVLECAVSGTPTPTVQWMRDGQSVSVDGSHILVKESMDGKISMTIKDATSADAGRYTCTATNPAGDAETKAELDVKQAEMVEQKVTPETAMELDTAPTFTKQLETTAVREGDNTKLECAVIGSPHPEVLWMKDGVAVEADNEHIQIESKPDGTQRLVITDARPEDIGEYRCEASSSAGVSWSDAALTVKKAVEEVVGDMESAAPEFVQVLHSCNAVESEHAELECKVKGTPMPSVRWLKDGEPIDDSIAKAVSLPDGTHKLVFSEASAADAGEYRCEASNDAGAAWTEAPLIIKTAQEMSLDDGEIAPDFLEPLHSVTAEEGECTAFECRISGAPAPEVKWFRDGEEISGDTARVTIESDEDGVVQRLKLDDAVVNDTGEYRCELSNPAGTTWSDATLNVQIPKVGVITDHQDDVAIENIEPLPEYISLDAAETPDAVYTVTHISDGTFAPDFKEEPTAVVEETIPRLTVEHVGLSNDHFPTSTPNTFPETDIFAEEEASSSSSHKADNISEGDSGSTILPDESAADTYASIDDISLENDAQQTEDLSQCTLGPSWEAEQVEIREEIAPEFLEELKPCKAEQGESVDLTCRVTGHPMPQVLWYKDGEQVLPDDTHKISSEPDGQQTLTITDAKEEDQGNYRVEATNVAGSHSSKAPLEVFAEEMEIEATEIVAPEFSKKLEACLADAGTVAVLECAVTGESPTVHWYKDGKELSPDEHVQIESLPDGTQRLIIEGAKEEDIGKYTCEAVNDAGSNKTEAPVQVSKPSKPAFSRGLKDIKIKMGQVVEMSCAIDINSVKGHPFEVKWYKNGKELEVLKRINLTKAKGDSDGVCMLTIADTTMEDTATYSCQISNAAGSVTTEATVTVEKGESAPEFTKKLSDVDVGEGETILLKCAATGEPMPEVTWSKNGKPLRIGGRVSSSVNPDGTIELKIKDSCLDDAAKFTCTIKNSAGTEQCDASVAVQAKPKSGPPKFIRELHDISAEAKTEVILEIEVNTPKVTIKWLKDGSDIAARGVDMERATDTVFRLIINSMKFEDSGTYTCTARNENGAVITTADLTLKRPKMEETVPLKFKKVLSDKKVKEGAKIILEVEVEGKPDTVKWHKPAGAAKGEDRIKVEKDKEKGLYRFILDAAKAEDAGEYSVEAIGENETIKSQCKVKVDIPDQVPEIVSPLEDVEAGAGDDVLLSVKTKGKPKVVKWYKNGKEIQPSKHAKPVNVGDDEFQLKLFDVGDDAAGEYKVVLENDAGTAESTAKLTIKEQAPTIKEPLKDREVTEGGTVVLEVVAQGTIDTVKWYKDGKEIIPDGKRVIAEKLDDGTCRLTIKESNSDDAGSFSVRLSNSAGTADSQAKLTVTAAKPIEETPVMIKGLEDTTVDEGDKLVLSIEVTGKPKQIKWYRNGQQLNETAKRKLEKVDDKTYRMVVADADNDDAGAYKVEVSNDAGTAQSQAAVTVKPIAQQPADEHPEIVKGLESVTAGVGDDVLFSIKTKGKPKVIKWYRNGQQIIPSKKEKPSVLGEDEFQLALKDVANDAAGDYKVVVENDAGSADSEAKLTIKKAPPTIKEPLTDREVTVDGTVVLEAVAQGEIDTIKWYKDGDEVKPSKKLVYEYLKDGTCRLTIKDCKKGDAGKYTVELANSAGSVASDANLKVIEAQVAAADEVPVFVKGLKDVAVDEGDKLVLQIEVKGKPKEIKWYRNGQLLQPTKNRRIEKVDDKTYRLVVPETVKEEDEGKYKVEVMNDTGTADTEANVTINLPAVVEKAEPTPDESVRIVLPLRDQTVPENDNINLKCQVAGVPFPEIAWLKDGKEVVASDKIFISVSGDGVCNLHVTGATPSDAGKYKCIAKNEKQEASTQCAVTVGVDTAEAEQSSPKFVVPLSAATATEGKTVTFDIKVRGKPTPTLKWMKDGVVIENDDHVQVDDMGDGRWRLTIKDATMSDAGKYACEAKNSLGSDATEAALRVTPGRDKRKPGDERYAPIFNVPLRDRRIPEHASMTVECFVDAKPKPDIQWTKDGEAVHMSETITTTFLVADGKCRLEIADFTEADQGVYKCIATNELGSAHTKATLSAEVIKMEVQDEKKLFAPRFVSNLGDRRIKEGSGVNLDCKVLASPTADITWFKDGIPIKATARIKIEADDDGTQTLKISDATEADDGAYRCVASNAAGTTNTSCMLVVDAAKKEKEKKGDAPTFSKGLTDVWVDKNTDIKLTCCVHGTPKPEIKWFKDGILLRDGGRTNIVNSEDGSCSLAVKACTFSDEGMYRCEATNALGSARTAATIHVEAVRESSKLVEVEEGEAPRFVIGMDDQKCIVGSSVEYEVKVTGKPVPQIKWSFNGLPLTQDSRVTTQKVSETNYKLIIKNATVNDDGTYRITASNESGTAHSKGMLSIDEGFIRNGLPLSTEPTAQPKFVVPFGDIRANEGAPFQLEVRLSGNPNPDVTWFKDGEKVMPSDRIKTEIFPDGTARLYVANTTPDDEGLYRCVASNPYGTDNIKGYVTVKASPFDRIRGFSPVERGKEPRLVIPLESTPSREGGSVTLSCKFTGDPKPTLKWMKDGERIYPFGRCSLKEHEDGTADFIITNLTVEDAGCYRCIAENDFGVARTMAEVTVQAKERKAAPSLDESLRMGKAPGFSKPLTVRRVKEEQPTCFECMTYGNPTPSIKWMKDGLEITPTDRIRVETDPSGIQKLWIDEVLNSDDGFYRCVASNEFGTSSSKAELIVEPDTDKRSLKAKAAEEEEEDSKPRIRRGLQNLNVTKGSPAEFEVAVGGKPVPTVKWYRNGQELKSDNRILMWKDDWGFHRLAILGTDTDDEATYSCEATNKLGSAKTQCDLTVLKAREAKGFVGPDGVEVLHDTHEGLPCPPGFLKQVKNKHSFSGMPAIFDCITTGSPNPEVDWYHNGQKVVATARHYIQSCRGGSHALVILRAELEDIGEYVAVARNASGTAKSSGVLDVTVPYLDGMKFGVKYDLNALLASDYAYKRTPYAGIPTPPDRGPFIAEVTGHYLTLSWIPTKRSPPRYPQVSYVIEMRQLPDPQWILLDYNIPEPVCKVRNLERGQSYQFRVRAENIYGISDPSPASPPSQLMAPPQPVLDKNKRPIPIRDPYMQDALDKAYGDQYACAPWFAPRSGDKVYCAENDSIELNFFVHGFPDPKIQWRFRGYELDTDSPTSRFRVTTLGGSQCVLNIGGFNKADAGQYQCFASNQYGDAQQNVFIELAERPTFIQPLSDKMVGSGKSVRFDCRVEGNPYPEIKWFKDWYPLVESSRVRITYEPPYLCSLVITDAILRDTGIYSCVATNEAYKSSTTATLTVEATLGAPDDVEIPRKKVNLTPRKIREIYSVEEEVLK